MLTDPRHQCGDRGQQGEEISQRCSPALVPNENCRVREEATLHKKTVDISKTYLTVYAFSVYTEVATDDSCCV